MSDEIIILLFLTAREVAKRYRIGVTTVWEMARDGRLPPPIKLTNKTTRWRLADLEAWEAKLAPGGSHE